MLHDNVSGLIGLLGRLGVRDCVDEVVYYFDLCRSYALCSTMVLTIRGLLVEASSYAYMYTNMQAYAT